MEDPASYPPIEPTNFDLIVIGTGLPESILAAAASAAGKSVLHLDTNPFYGGHFASLALHDFTTFLQTHSQPEPSPAKVEPDASGEFTVLPLDTRPLYSAVEITAYSPEIVDNSRKFCLDLAGPRVCFCADEMIDLILKTDINQYMEFKSVDGSFICEDGKGNLGNVPDSRSVIFKDKSLTLAEKNQLMRFFKLVQGHFGDSSGEDSKKISEEDLESPFVEFLRQKMGLSKKLKSIILYAISMADYDQDNKAGCKYVLKTKEGIDRLILYHSSVGRFPNAPGAMIYPIYGQGEFPQAFCRRAAVKGCIYVLRMPVIGLLMEKDAGNYKGVKLVSGQELFSHQLVLAPSFISPPGSTLSPLYTLQDGSYDFDLQGVKEKVARGICITKSSVKPAVANSLCPEQLTAVRIFQLSSNVAVCPSGMFVIYLSAMCDDPVQGKNLLTMAINALFSSPVSAKSEENSMEHQNENAVVNVKPTLLWSAVYIQELAGVMTRMLARGLKTASDSYNGTFDCISSTPMPDGSLQYNNILEATRRLFQKMYPNEEFFPRTISAESHG